jgi:hypothetical protein
MVISLLSERNCPSSIGDTVWEGRIFINDVLGWTWKEAAVSHFKVISQRLSEGLRKPTMTPTAVGEAGLLVENQTRDLN